MPEEQIVPAVETTPVVPPAEGTDAKVATLEDRNNALQSSLDAALEELANKNQPVPAEPVIPAAAPTPAPAPVEPPKPAAAPTPIAPATPPQAMSKEDQDAAWAKALEEKDKKWEERFNNLELRDVMIELTADVKQAIAKYPLAKERDVLLAIEEGSDKSVEDIAKDLHSNHEKFLNEERTKIEEKVRAELLKENKGGISIPQSTGTSSTPDITPAPQGEVPFKRSHDDAWAAATREAKAAAGNK